MVKGEEPTVLAIPRGGVVVGEEIAKKLGCSLDVIISKKITPPSSPEYAIGAITHDGTIYQGQNWDIFSQERSRRGNRIVGVEVVQRLIRDFRSGGHYKFDNKT